MTRFTCENCGRRFGDVRLVEHGTDDIALCKTCFRMLQATVEDTDATGFPGIDDWVEAKNSG